ncbi:MAG TPA: PQQ-binding-like beta-propeller repeat protein [Actinomycetota bacterium]|nr:PQQ-binding-like beta-propeller repeat protein [Actinomycetota bacterium]
MIGRSARLTRVPRRRRAGFAALVVALLAASGAAAAWRVGVWGDARSGPPAGDGPLAHPSPGQDPPRPSPDPFPSPEPINRTFEGLTTFRGNATRTYYGEGPVPSDPEVLWRFPPTGGMCSRSADAEGTRLWCGTGWTGQPNVVDPPEGPVEVRFGAYDRAVHVVHGRTGRELMEPFVTGDIIKGTVTSDPDGYPLLYTGSRDDHLRILALDRGSRPVELWRLSADSAPDPVWNDDWDGSPLIVDGHLLEGGENSWFYVVELNRGYDEAGRVTVDPEIRMMVPGFDDRLFADLADDQVSIENSVAFDEDRGVVYFANSGGLVQGWDIADVLDGGDRYRRVFRFWTGEDVDASVVIDRDGFLYVAAEQERFNARGEDVGQLLKLDPSAAADPLVWSVDVPGGGLWATPGLYRNAVIAATNSGRILGVHRRTGAVRWELELAPPTWPSPVVVDGVLVVADCSGAVRAYRLKENPLSGRPRPLWSVQLEGCVESTPAVWKGMVYVGARGGAVYGIGDP